MCVPYQCPLCECHDHDPFLAVCLTACFSSDIGWKPFVESWAATREDANERQFLPSLFEKYVEVTRTIVRKGFKEVTPLRVLNKVQSQSPLQPQSLGNT